MNSTIQTRWLALSERVYRRLLIFYPAEYRHDYGALMVQVFRDVLRDTYRRRGMVGVMLWWAKALLDLALTAIEQRRKVKSTMSKSTFTQPTGLFLILGGIFGALAAFSQFQPGNHTTYAGIYQFLSLLFAPSFLLVGLGCIGLAQRCNQTLGTLGQWTLYLTSIGAFVMAVGIVAQSIEDSLWAIWPGGGILHALGLTAFGLLHLRKPALPIFRALPLQIAGGWLFMVFGLTGLFPQPIDNLLAFLLFLGMGLAWLAIGLTVHREQKATALVVG